MIVESAKPGELPVEQPAKFELILSLKTCDRSNAIGNDYKGVPLRREVAPVARHEPQPALLRNGSLKRVGQSPAMIPAQRRGKIGGRLLDSQRRKAIEELDRLAQGALLESGQNFGACNDRNSRIGVVF